ncbi:DUF4062 domain-containing protein [Pelomonas sp. V22]|uniref:DUF4062 domain-containing protein n=1 Tax=Pelomonas sp. V22 TaxID=2822139 RepID=UPI0024A84A25|nr:DUF4062 domain-containing protein [Pelomonas sp. V22]MDI4635542.1 DUF4062 domain-containing protein [Pelomonas sp. V22]
MARLRVFVSSTCYDLDIVRSELRPFIVNCGYEPVMSDYSDVLFDPRLHTHDSCVKEVVGCDVVVLIIGSRFGGTAVPAALASVDWDAVAGMSSSPTAVLAKEKLSITQLEVIKAVESAVPVYAFVDERVLHDHLVYEKNKDNPLVVDQMVFPSIQKKETAKYIFEFINFLSHRLTGNSVIGFSRLEEIRLHLVSQWSQLFQRLLEESQTRTAEARRYRDFSERIEDLKAVVLASLATPGLRDTAKGAVQFRHLIDFVSGLRDVDQKALLLSNIGWDELLERAGIVETRIAEEPNRLISARMFLVRADGTFYIMRLPPRVFESLQRDWASFQRVESRSREAIVDALLEESDARSSILRYRSEPIDEFLAQREPPRGDSLDAQS